MPHRTRRFVLGVLAVAVCGRAAAQDRCTATGTMGGKKFTMSHCAVAVYDGSKSVAFWFTDSPLPSADVDTFHLSSYAKTRGSDNKPLTMIGMSFCPGGGKEAARPDAVKTVEMGVNDASDPMLGQNWLFELPRDKDLKVEKLSGEVKPGGKLSGRITGKKTTEQKQAYSWEIDFDVRLPERTAGAGLACD